MMRLARLLLALFVLGELAGCAYAQLRIRVDQYDEDPRIDLPMPPAKANELIENLQALDAEARADAALRIQLATDAYQIYRSAWLIVGKTEDKLVDLKAELDSYLQAVGQAYDDHADVTDIAVQGLLYYVEEYQRLYGDALASAGIDGSCNKPETKTFWQRVMTGPPRTKDAGDECLRLSIRKGLYQLETEVMAATAAAISSFQTASLPEPVDGSGVAITSFNVDWTGLEFAINAAYYTARIRGNEEEMKLYRQLGDSIVRRIRSMTQAVAASGRPVPVNALRSPYTPSTLQGSSLAIANEMETLRNDLPATATSRVALANLVTGTSRFFEVIDRLQDAGDPVWRIVRDPENEQHWQKKVAETFFYAEGDAGVVVVRDDPVHYRVHSARNDPTVLVQSQLEISRSLANAAISIAGAASGLPTDSLASSASGRTTDAATAGEQDGLAARDARVQAWQKQRTVALTSLHRYLRAVATNLEDIDDNDQVALQRQVSRLRAILDGHRPLFAAAAEESE